MVLSITSIRTFRLAIPTLGLRSQSSQTSELHKINKFDYSLLLLFLLGIRDALFSRLIVTGHTYCCSCKKCPGPLLYFFCSLFQKIWY